jgi:NAD(P)-dependent dehydrogenase (short-subunit alcohol dehydrogenase family)
MEERRTVLITGCSSGFGLLSALRFAREGWRVAATMRDPAKAGDLKSRAEAEGLAGIVVDQLDVTSDESVRRAVIAVHEREGNIDALVNNAGYGYFAFVEDGDLDEVRANFETNVFGLLRVTQQVIPIMREQRSGRVVNLSSLVGRFAFPLSGLYAGTKHAVEAISEALAYEVAAFGISVSVVQPGTFPTNFQTTSPRGSPKTKDPNSPYAPLLVKVKERRNAQAAVSGDPAQVADAIYRAVTDDPPKMWYRVGVDAEEYLGKRRTLPEEDWVRFMMDLHKT